MNVALILSGGFGTRLGADIPKQYIKVNNKMIISYCMETIIKHPLIDAVWIVADSSWQDELICEFSRVNLTMDKFCGFSSPGASRQESIWNGLKDIRDHVDKDSYVMIHDAARPLLSADLISRCVEGCCGYDGVMPVIPVKDTMYYTTPNGNEIDSLMERNRLVAGQTPELFHLEKYYNALKDLTLQELNDIHGSTEPAYRAGLRIALVSGEERNYKVTTKEDLDRFSQQMIYRR